MKVFYIFLLILIITACDDSSSQVENCSDSKDNDGDGMIDCLDEDCLESEFCFNGENLCGNGFKDEGEECDIWDFAGESCESHSYSGGELYCSAQCTISLSACHSCGNEICEAGEDSFSCLSDCPEDFVNDCGNDKIDEYEDCDGSNFNHSCLDLDAGYTGGLLYCSSSCLYDYSACTYCGNGICEAGEGPGNCLVDCSLGEDICGNGECEIGEDPINCPQDCEQVDPSICGNGIREMGESCDMWDFAGQDSCSDWGYDGGDLYCDGDFCTVYTGDCWLCGDGICDEDLGENQSNCFLDCNSSPTCNPVDMYISRQNVGETTLHGATMDCGNYPYGWQEVSFFEGDAILFNAYDSSGDFIYWVGTSCNSSTLHWDITGLNMILGSTGVCWAVCTPSGPNACCSVDGNFPSICGNSQTEKRLLVPNVY